MTIFLLKTLIAAIIIAFCSWLANKRPDIAGFIIAMPILSLVALAFTYTEFKNPQTSIAFAKSIFVGVPVSLLFFIPFLFAEKLQLTFWQTYFFGFLLLVVGYFLHKAIWTQL